MSRILIVEDERHLADGLRFNLHNNKWGTNFRMWWEARSFTARFILELT